jgi:2-amino-4-hydroxy-6-hydroxymethyldihydropteridine diphosphokinase
MVRAGIALGSNLGDRLANLRAAVGCLKKWADPGGPVLIAPVYRTEPLACPAGSPYFFNSAIEIGFEGDAFDLLEIGQEVEKKLGRGRATERNAPRIIDVDLLYFGSEVIDSETLVLPHPRIGERRFVLQPLAEIRPDLVLPGETRNIAALLDGLRSEEPPLIAVEGNGNWNEEGIFRSL